MKLLRVTNPTMGVLIFFSAVLTVTVIILLGDRSYYLRQHKTRSVAERVLLAELATRTTVHLPGSDACLQVAYTPGRAPGLFHGYACSQQWDHQNQATRTFETHLAFGVDQLTAVQRDPTLPPRLWLRLVRDDLSSDYPAADQPPAEGESLLALSLAGESGAIRISNQPDTPGVAYSGTALTDEPLEYPLYEPKDELFLIILSRVLRVHICDQLPATTTRCYDSVLLIYRGTKLDTYYIDLQALGHDLGLLRISLKLDREHALGRLQVITKESTLQRRANLYLVSPHPYGELLTPSDPGFQLLHYQPPPKQPKTFEVDFKLLLDGTAWPSPGPFGPASP